MRFLKERLISGDGRWMIHAPPNYQGKRYIKGLYIYEHRFLMEQKFDRFLRSDEIVHHINGNKIDNRIKNLEILTKQNHIKYHSNERRMKPNCYCFGCGIYFPCRRYLLKRKKFHFHNRECYRNHAKKMTGSQVGKAPIC